MAGQCALASPKLHNQPSIWYSKLAQETTISSCLEPARLLVLTCMPPNALEDLSRSIETLYRSESGRILATLVRLLGDLDLAEEAMHEAFAAALETWPQTGLPCRFPLCPNDYRVNNPVRGARC